MCQPRPGMHAEAQSLINLMCSSVLRIKPQLLVGLVVQRPPTSTNALLPSLIAMFQPPEARSVLPQDTGTYHPAACPTATKSGLVCPRHSEPGSGVPHPTRAGIHRVTPLNPFHSTSHFLEVVVFTGLRRY